MAASSIHSGIVPFAPSLWGTDDDPEDTVLHRDGTANGLLHAADSIGQVRVNYMPVAAGVADGQETFATIDTGPEADVYYHVGVFGRWPLTIRADGTPYRLRIRVAGASSSTNDAPTFRVVIAPNFPEALAGKTSDEDSVFEASGTATTTIAWLSGTSQGSAAAATYVQVSAEQARDWTAEQVVFDAVNAGTPRSIQQCLVSAWVWAKQGGVDDLPRLYGLHIQEFYQ